MAVIRARLKKAPSKTLRDALFYHSEEIKRKEKEKDDVVDKA